jgi:D-arginine dehydrogenase
VGCLRPEVVHGALFEHGAQDIDVHALHQGFLRGMRGRGGELRTGAQVVAAQRDGARWTLRLADGEAVQAHAVVDAAGAWADEVATLFGAAPIGLVPHRRSAFTFKAPEGLDVSGWPAVVGVDESYYFKPDAGQLLGSPANADPTLPHDVIPEELDIALGIHQIEAVTTLTIRRPASTWAGLRSFVRDGEMVIGWDERCPGFFWLAGQGGYGIQSAAGASELAASLLRGTPLPPELTRHGIDPHALAPQRLR